MKRNLQSMILGITLGTMIYQFLVYPYLNGNLSPNTTINQRNSK